jgi:hypothetical protein
MDTTDALANRLFRPYALAALTTTFRNRFHDFNHRDFVGAEVTYKRKAQERFKELLAQDQLDPLIAGGQFEDAKTVIKRAYGGSFDGVQNNLLNQYDMLTVVNAPAEPLTRALYDVLYGTGAFSPRLDAWIRVLSHDKPTVWPAATYVLMMHDPSKHIFVKAEPYKKLLHALHSKVTWEPHPTAARYAQIQVLASALLEKLAPMGARDMIDVQSFIYVMFPTKGWDASERVSPISPKDRLK